VVIAVLGLLLSAASLYVGWRLGRRQILDSPSSTTVSDDQLQILREIADTGPVEQGWQVPKDSAGTLRTYVVGGKLIDAQVPANDWIRIAFRDLENVGLIASPELGKWPIPGPRKSWINDAGRSVVRANEKREVATREIIEGRRPGTG
jgi:hypothetical protein